MPDRPYFSDESVLMKWMNLEIGKINRGLVAERKTLHQLFSEVRPASVTKCGDEYIFRPEVVRELGEKLPERLHGRLKLPIFCYFDSSVYDSCFISDEHAVEALKLLGELSEMRAMSGGRLWIGKPIVYHIIRKYPSIVQIVMR